MSRRGRPPRRGEARRSKRLNGAAVVLAVCLAGLALAAPGYALWRSLGPPPERVAGQAAPPASEAGDRTAPIRLRHGTVPILTYHGVAAGDPSRYTVTPAEFDDQMRSLRDAGFTAITTSQFAAFMLGEDEALPQRPILITFDDGIRNVWINGDPILKRYGLRAVMFTITGSVGQHGPYYLNWSELKAMQDSGRWDVESHTRNGHRPVPINGSGGTGPFLTNLAWNPEAGRVETMDEWNRRVVGDLDGSIADLRSHGLPRPVMLAFPFSASSLPTNYYEIPSRLRTVVRDRFPLAVDNVDRLTLADRGSDHSNVPRIEILRGTSGSELIAKLRNASRSFSLDPARDGGRASMGSGQASTAGPPEAALSLVNDGNLDDANAIVAGRWPVPRFPAARLAQPLSWTDDPYRAKYWRFIFYGLRPTTNLLWAYRRTGHERYLTVLLRTLREYLAYDETREGLSPETLDDKHASAFRAMVLVNTYHNLRRTGDLPADVDGRLREAIRRLGAFLEKDENFEADHNHGLNEAVALMLIAHNFPDVPESAGWATEARTRLKVVLDNQVEADGVQVENSPFYHFYSLRILLEVRAWQVANGVEGPPLFDAVLWKMARYAAAVTQPNGRIPLLGASVAMDVGGFKGSTRTALAELDPALAFQVTRALAGEPPRQGLQIFRDAGQAILRAGKGRSDLTNTTFMTFDAGPYRTEHSHLDALSLTLFAGGEVLLPDSGLYTYEPGPEFDYFHGTRAHNTVVVDGQDQRPGAAQLGKSGRTSGGALLASGRSRLSGETHHRRAVIVLREGVILVVDHVSGERVHDFDQTWHFESRLQVRASDGGLEAIRDGRTRLRLIQGSPFADLTISRGRRDPIQGWTSEQYGIDVPSAAAEFRARGREATFVTLLVAGEQAETPSSLNAVTRGAGFSACVEVGGASYRAAAKNVGSRGGLVVAGPADRC